MKQVKEDEIDLGQLLILAFKTLKKYKILILTFAILGIAAGGVWFYVKRPVYESSMMLRSDILTEAYSNTLTDNLGRLIDERGYDVLAKKLSLSLQQASHLKRIYVESVEASTTGNVTQNVIFLISVEVTDKSILTDLENGIRQYLEGNEYVKKRTELKRQRLLSLIEKSQADIAEMDSLKADFINGKAYNQAAPEGNVVIFDPTNIYTKIMTFYKEEISYIQGLELIESIQMIEGFTPFAKPVSPKRLLSLASGLSLGLILALMIIIFKETTQYLKKMENQEG